MALIPIRIQNGIDNSFEPDIRMCEIYIRTKERKFLITCQPVPRLLL